MDIRILGWKADGLRGALEDFEIDLSDTLKPNILIQMPTGTGKTTTMSLLRKAFSGASFSADEIRSYRAESDPASGRFALSLALEQDMAKVVIDFDFEGEKASFTTVLTPGGNRRGHALPRPYSRLLTPALARLFIFDGELATELRNQDLTRADEAVEALYRLSVLSTLRTYADEALDLKRKLNVHGTAQKPTGVTRRTTERDEAAARLAELKREREEAVDEKAKVDAELDTLLAEIERLAQHSSKLDEAFEKAKEAVNDAGSTLDERHAHICSHFVRPQNLHPKIAERLSACYDQIEAAKLPGPSSTEWFEWLTRQKYCVCGTPISEHERDAIRAHKEQYLGGQQHGLINEIKYALKVGASAITIDDRIIEDLDRATADYRSARQQRTEAENRRVREAGGDIEALRDRQKSLERDSDKLRGQINRLESSDATTWKDSIPACKAELDRRDAALNEAEGTYELFRKVEAVKRLLDEVEIGTIARVREAIQTRTNEKLRDVIHAERLSLEAIDNALTLTGMSRQRDDVSVGQSLAIAYAFLTSLFQHASYRLPFVVDSPAGPIDVATRQSVSKLLPEMFPQLIMFVQSGERVGFVEAFYERNDVQYLTCWREDGRIRREAGMNIFQVFHTDEDANAMSEGGAQ